MVGLFRKKSAPSGPDFSKIDSLEKAKELTALGELEKLYLMPLEFGGEDIPQNIVYVPVGIASIKSRTDSNIIAPLIANGKVTKYAATPEYQGRSFVPISIEIVASDPGEFTTRIEIWGAALAREIDA